MVELEIERLLEVPRHSLRANTFVTEIKQVGLRWPSISLNIKNQTEIWLSGKTAKTINQMLSSQEEYKRKQGEVWFNKSHWYEIESASTTIIGVSMLGNNKKLIQNLLKETYDLAFSLKGGFDWPEIDLYNGDLCSPYFTEFRINFIED